MLAAMTGGREASVVLYLHETQDQVAVCSKQ